MFTITRQTILTSKMLGREMVFFVNSNLLNSKKLVLAYKRKTQFWRRCTLQTCVFLLYRLADVEVWRRKNVAGLYTFSDTGFWRESVSDFCLYYFLGGKINFNFQN